MTRDAMLRILGTINFEYIDPPAEWEDIGFTERPIWVNSKGYGYLSCDDPSNLFWKGVGVEQSRWEDIRTKLFKKILTIDDLKETSLIDLLNTMTFGDFPENVSDLCDCLEGLLDLPCESAKTLYCMSTISGWQFFCDEEAFLKAYERVVRLRMGRIGG